MSHTIEEIASLAIKMEKPKKATAHLLIKNIIQGDCNPLALAGLYNYFMPPKPNITKAAKDHFAWLSLAVSKEPRKHPMNLIYVDNQHEVATDGRRIHMTSSAFRPRGFYDHLGQRIEISPSRNFPDYKAIIPAEELLQTAINPKTELRLDSESSRLRIIDLPELGLTFNADFWEQATAGMKKVIIKYQPSDAPSPCIITNNYRKAILMPMRP